MTTTSHKVTKRIRRHARIRARVSGTAERPRLAVFRSNRFLYAQLINDESGVTIFGTDTRKVAEGNATERARALGKILAEGARAKGITKVVFDRGGFQYQGAIIAFAESARTHGLEF